MTDRFDVDFERRVLMHQARHWVRHMECPLPTDLIADMLEVGLDANAIEERLLANQGEA